MGRRKPVNREIEWAGLIALLDPGEWAVLYGVMLVMLRRRRPRRLWRVLAGEPVIIGA